MVLPTCGYCGKPVLTGDEDEEHVLPAAINARLVTRAVCTPCNRWAGKHIDKPWLNDPFVQHLRFLYEIPDRRGNVLEYDPLLRGVTDDGAHIRMGRDGKPEPMNSVVKRDPETGEVKIWAKDEEDLERLIEREKKKAEAAGKTFEMGTSEPVETHPRVNIAAKVYPGMWERMAAKVCLGLLSETQPHDWRTSSSADLLRERMHDLNRRADDVLLRQDSPALVFAPAPSSAVIVRTLPETVVAEVSLLGTFAVMFDLGQEMSGIDLAWVSDPIEPERSYLGPQHEVVAGRIL